MPILPYKLENSEARIGLPYLLHELVFLLCFGGQASNATGDGFELSLSLAVSPRLLCRPVVSAQREVIRSAWHYRIKLEM